jgi:hypothetical protein
MEETVKKSNTISEPHKFIERHRKVFLMLGIFGGLLIQLIIGSVYQWGIINIYITSYFRTMDNSVTV